VALNAPSHAEPSPPGSLSTLGQRPQATLGLDPTSAGWPGEGKIWPSPGQKPEGCVLGKYLWVLGYLPHPTPGWSGHPRGLGKKCGPEPLPKVLWGIWDRQVGVQTQPEEGIWSMAPDAVAVCS
jgi:hypothetical protein